MDTHQSSRSPTTDGQTVAAASSPTPVVAVENIRKSYGDHEALKTLSFEIQRGEIFALLGPNGAGKTTLLRILTGVLPPDGDGQVRIMGQPGLQAVRTQVGYLPEERGLYKKQKVGDILQYLGELKGLSGKAAREQTRRALAQVGMDAHENSITDTLSKGMAQRVQIASALVHDPPFLILDEPFSGLDPVSARQMQDLVLEEKRKGRTVLLSTHQMEPVERLCDRLLMLHRGQKVLYGTVQEARARFSEGLLRVEHESERIAESQLPTGFVVQEAVTPHVTRLFAPKENTPQQSLAALVAAGVSVRGFAVVTPTLEEIFVKIVGQELPPADPTSAE